MTRDQYIYEQAKAKGHRGYKIIAKQYGLSVRRIKYIVQKESFNEKIRELQEDVRRYRNKYYEAIIKK